MIAARWTAREFKRRRSEADKKYSDRAGIDTWIAAFRRVGRYPRGRRQGKSLTLYRGAPAEFAAGLSWTSDIAVAKFFRDQWREASVYEIRTTETELIAYIDMTPRWFEYLIDGRLHDISEVPGTRHCNPHGRMP